MIDRFSWMAIYPEIVLLVMACVITLVDLLDRNPRRMAAYALSVLTLLVLAVLTGTYALGGQTWYGFEGMVVSDPMANWLKCFAALSVAVTLVYARTYVTGRGMLRGAEWYVLSLLSLLGMYVLISANNFLRVDLGPQCMTLSSYAMVAQAMSVEEALSLISGEQQEAQEA